MHTYLLVFADALCRFRYCYVWFMLPMMTPMMTMVCVCVCVSAFVYLQVCVCFFLPQFVLLLRANSVSVLSEFIFRLFLFFLFTLFLYFSIYIAIIYCVVICCVRSVRVCLFTWPLKHALQPNCMS